MQRVGADAALSAHRDRDPGATVIVVSVTGGDARARAVVERSTRGST
jgi:hypothetical protein